MQEAKTIMKKNVITLYPQDTLDKAIKLMIENTITGIPVINEDQTLVGIITEKDILNYLIHQKEKRQLADGNLCEHTVYHAMTASIVVTFSEDAPIDAICECLAKHSFRRVPIVDEEDKLVGIISRKDLIAFIS